MTNHSPQRGVGRPPVQQEAVREELRQRILHGTWAPGCRLPSRLDLVRELRTTSSTLQSALDDLREDGLVVTQGSRGTFVSTQAPHRFHYGILFPQALQALGEGEENLLWKSLHAAVSRYPDAHGRRITEYFGRHWQAESVSYQQLIADCQFGRLAGLLIVQPSTMLVGSPLLTAAVPRVFLSSVEAPLGDARIHIDGGSFRRSAIQRLSAGGCKQVAVIAGAGAYCAQSTEVQAWLAELAAAGISSRESWMLCGDILYAASITNTVRLLMERCDHQPDGIVVADDNLLPGVIAGLQAEGLSVGRDVQVIAHANFPLTVANPAGVVRIGLDTQRVIADGIRYCEAIHAGEQPLSHLIVPLDKTP